MLALPVVAAQAATTGNSSCKPLQINQPAVASAMPREATPAMSAAAVVTQLYPGQLEPQIRRMLKEHLAIKVLDWQASPHHQWPTEHQVSADSWAEVLRRILQPYKLQLVMHPNHSAVVRYRTL
jgi:hypothetical protein